MSERKQIAEEPFEIAAKFSIGEQGNVDIPLLQQVLNEVHFQAGLSLHLRLG
jgi:hypothetical protein